MLGGDISGDSTPGEGSTFLVSIETGPLAGLSMLNGPDEAVHAQAMESSAAAKTNVRLSARVLLAEDGPDNQRLIAFLLTQRGASVTVAENGRVAVEKVVQARDAGQPFDCVLMDMQMPVLDGYGAAQELRAGRLPHANHCPDGPLHARRPRAMSGGRLRRLPRQAD